MTYLILDYAAIRKQAVMPEKTGYIHRLLQKYTEKYSQSASGSESTQHDGILFKLFKQSQMNKQLQQLAVEKQMVRSKDQQQDFMYITVRATPKELAQLQREGVQGRIREAIAEENVCILQAEPDLYQYLPQDIGWAEESDEIYINLLRRDIMVWLAKGHVEKKYARLVFLVEQPLDALPYIDSLSRGFNYVSVCAKQHEEMEELYKTLYDEEGLMVEALPWDVHKRPLGDVAVDLTSNPKGLHRLYPEGASVLDLSISHEKERMLAQRGGNRNYVQILNVRNFLTLGRE